MSKIKSFYVGNSHQASVKKYMITSQDEADLIISKDPDLFEINRGNFLLLQSASQKGECISEQLKTLCAATDELDLSELLGDDEDIDLDFLLDDEPEPNNILTAFTDDKYSIIYADPPWSYSDKSKQRGGAERHYSTMSLDEIKKLPVNTVTDKQAVLFMWVTMPMLKEGLEVINAWGFKYTTCGFNWVKRNKVAETLFMGGGHYTRANAEVCLIGVKGKPLPRLSRSIRQTQIHPVQEHSKKPDVFADQIVELFGNLPRIELFARDCKYGWDNWGDKYGFLKSTNAETDQESEESDEEKEEISLDFLD